MQSNSSLIHNDDVTDELSYVGSSSITDLKNRVNICLARLKMMWQEASFYEESYGNDSMYFVTKLHVWRPPSTPWWASRLLLLSPSPTPSLRTSQCVEPFWILKLSLPLLKPSRLCLSIILGLSQALGLLPQSWFRDLNSGGWDCSCPSLTSTLSEREPTPPPPTTRSLQFLTSNPTLLMWGCSTTSLRSANCSFLLLWMWSLLPLSRPWRMEASLSPRQGFSLRECW